MDDTARLNHLDREQESQDSDSSVTERLDRWLAMVIQRGASDLLLVSGAPPCMRVNGEVRKIEPGLLDGPEIEAAVLPALPRHAMQQYREVQITDASYRITGLGRFRINLHREQGRAAAAIRVLPARVPQLKELSLPPSVEQLAHLPRGLVLDRRACGLGQIHHDGRAHRRHQSPRVAPHRHHRRSDRVRASAHAQHHRADRNRRGCARFSDGAARRAASGARHHRRRRNARHRHDAHRCCRRRNGPSRFQHAAHDGCRDSIARISDSFPVERQNSIRQELAMAIAAVHTQILLAQEDRWRPRSRGELLMIGYGARHHIRRNALQHLHQEIAITKKKGSFSLEESLVTAGPQRQHRPRRRPAMRHSPRRPRHPPEAHNHRRQRLAASHNPTSRSQERKCLSS